MGVDRRWPGGPGVRSAAPVVAVLLALGVLAVAPTAAPAAPKRDRAQPRLKAFSSCATLVSYARRNARRTDGATGVPTRALPVPAQIVGPPPFMDADAPASATPAPAGAAPAFSETNVQEIGVDEPDIVKTDGRRLLAVTDGTLHAFAVTAGAPRLAGSLKLAGFGHRLLVRGDRVLVLASAPGDGSGDLPLPPPAPQARTSSTIPPDASTTLLSEIDVSDPAAMAVRRTMMVDGKLIDARQTAGTARIVVASTPGAVPESRIGRAGVRTWVPRSVLRSRVSGRTFRRAVADCDDVRRPPAFSGLDLTTVLTVDLDRGLFSVDRDAIMAGAQTVYASTRSLYVASRRYQPALEARRSIPSGVRTEIHRFDATRPDATTYRSSGDVTGFVLGQYSMSEHEGVLRVASTSEPQWFADRPGTPSESFVTVLDERGGALSTVGRVGGLGRGERIYAVRFLGDKGYVVTFRQVDPLYTLDLSRPSRPTVLGELKIQGYSAYLHPVSDDLLLGIGQDATDAGRTLGTQLSLFDVSDLKRPRRVAQAALGSGSESTVELEPRAFQFWRPTGLAVLPLRRFTSDAGPFAGAVGFRVGRSALTEVGRVEHRTAGGQIAPVERSVVIGERLYTLSYAGLQASRLDTLAPVGFAATR